MIYIFTELIGLIEVFCQESSCYDSLHDITNNYTYKTISNILKNNYEVKCGIPYIVLFDNDDYIDSVRHDQVKHNPFYDENSGCFVFLNINTLILGVYEMLKKIHLEHPSDTEVERKYKLLKMFIQKVYKDYKRKHTESELCDLFNNFST